MKEIFQILAMVFCIIAGIILVAFKQYLLGISTALNGFCLFYIHFQDKNIEKQFDIIAKLNKSIRFYEEDSRKQFEEIRKCWYEIDKLNGKR
jgi:hypothetical protein